MLGCHGAISVVLQCSSLWSLQKSGSNRHITHYDMKTGPLNRLLLQRSHAATQS